MGYGEADGMASLSYGAPSVLWYRDIFRDFVERELLPQLFPFNGSNSNSVVVMDNASIHHSQEIFQVLGHY